MKMTEDIALLCKIKAEEFKLYGYANILEDQIWKCVSQNYTTNLPSISKLTNDILSLKITYFMNWLMLSIYKTR